MNPTKAEKHYWDQLASIVGCLPCAMDGHPNRYVSIHHCEGRTKPGCHRRVIALCSSHHQDGTGPDKDAIAVHPWKKRFEEVYGTQEELMAASEELVSRSSEK